MYRVPTTGNQSHKMIEVKLNPDVTPAGSDLSIVNAARRSFNQRSDWQWSQGGTGPFSLREKDKRLLQYLARGMTADDFDSMCGDLRKNTLGIPLEDFKEKLWQWRNTPTHDTPVNHTFISFEVKAPIFVARQLVKHEYLIFSEFSRRYKTEDIEFYVPDMWRKAAKNKKQGSSDTPVDWWTMDSNLPAQYMESLVDLYERMLDEGVAPEQARMVLPQSTMTEWTWSGTLGAFAKMCRLRLHPEAQYESRLVAQQVYKYLKEYYPVAAKAFVEGADV